MTTTLEHLNRYLEWAETVQRKRHLTLLAYKQTLEKFAALHPDAGQVTADDIEAFMGRPRRTATGRPSAATAKRDRDAIRSFYKFLVSRHIVDWDPTQDVGVPTVRNRVPRAIPDELWAQVWGSRLCPDDRMWLGLGYFAGLRRFEIATISPDLFDVETHRILKFERKGGSEFAIEYGDLARVVADHIPQVGIGVDRWLDLVSEYATLRKGCEFLSPSSTGKSITVDTGWYNKRLCVILRDAGLPADTFTPHALRHSCATNLLRSGVPLEIIADQLSHASIETTRRYLQTSGQLGRWRLNGAKEEGRTSNAWTS